MQEENTPLLEDLFHAYYLARKNKRYTHSALKFEMHYEKNIFNIYREITQRIYKPKRSICFGVRKPVCREIFAADFSDRIVHHLIYNYISEIFEKHFINDCYSCRKGKGVHYAVNRVEKFVRSCSQNYKYDCYILKLDIQSYFMSIRKELLYQMVKKILLKEKKINLDLDLVMYLVKKTIFDEPEKNCIFKNKVKVPFGKSLFDTPRECGLPIGNLTSQLFGNVYLNSFDHFVKKTLGFKYYGRYVDDFVIVHRDKEVLKKAISDIKKYLSKNLKLTLHPKKIYLQHYSKGYQFLGTFVKPYRRYVNNRVKGNFISFLKEKKQKENYISSVHSYLGIMSHSSSYNLRKTILEKYIDKGIYNISKNKRKIFFVKIRYNKKWEENIKL